MRTLASTLDAVREHLPEALVSPDAFGRARAAVGHLPAAVTRCVHFECRMHDRSSQVDLVLAVYERGAAILARHRPLAAPASTREARWWDRIQAFCRTWTSPSSTLRSLVDHAWLEYDVHGPAAGGRHARSIPAPGVFISLRTPRPDRDSEAPLYGRAMNVIETLAGETMSPRVTDAFRTCVDLLPDRAEVHHIGLLATREAPTLRICIARLPPTRLGPYIASTAGVNPADVDTLLELAECRIGSERELSVPMLHLDIDVHGEYLPRIGIERPFARRCQSHGLLGPEERRLLDRLTARNLCARSKRDAVGAWPGRSVCLMPHELWWSRVDRRVNHIKLVAQPGADIEVKAYLFMSYLCHSRPGRPAHGAALGG